MPDLAKKPVAYGARAPGPGSEILNQSPSAMPTPKTVWGVFGSMIMGALCTLIISYMNRKGAALTEVEQGMIMTIGQGLAALGVSYITPPAGWSGNYGKENGS